MEIKGRFAPSPSGRMHLGNVFSALLSWLSVRSRGGQWLLRIEDLDRQRCRAEYAAQIEDDLQWLGLDWDEGGTRGGPSGPYSQSLRDGFYAEAFARLDNQGLVYPCFCRRADLLAARAPHASDGNVVYAGTCRRLSAEEREAMSRERKPASRLVVRGDIDFSDIHYGEKHCRLETECGDIILRRADGNFAYNLAVVVDDALMGVTEVVRGCDLLSATPVQIYIARLLGYAVPHYAHVPLLVAPDGRRLAKRDFGTDMDWLRRHFAPAQIIGTLAWYAGLIDKPEAVSANELLPEFSWHKVPTENIVVDVPHHFPA